MDFKAKYLPKSTPAIRNAGQLGTAKRLDAK
jgi:hypothetical protein